jgi:hypothetical protein
MPAVLGGGSVKYPVAILLALSLVTSGAQAQQTDERARSAARALAEDGVTALQSGDTATAIDKLERAYQIVHLPAVGIWSARALAKGGQLVSAAERYNDVTRWSGSGDPKQAQAQADAAKERDELLPKIPKVTLLLQGAKPNEVAVTLDGEPVMSALVGAPQPIDPKHHVAKATRGTESAEQAFDIAEGQQLSVTLTFGAAAATAAPVAAAPVAATTPADVQADHAPSYWNTQRIIGVSLAGAGVAAGIVSGIFTGMAASKKSDSEAYCSGSACWDQRGVTALDDAHSNGNVATITAITGIVLAGAGVVVFLTAPSGSGSVAVTPAYVNGGGSVLATGRF